MRYFYLFSLILFTSLISCKQGSEVTNEQISESYDDDLGEISIKVTGNEDAQAHFRTGLLLMHSFEYDDARTAFLEAQEADSTMVMAYWGEAMTFNHSLWQRQELDKALEALNKLSPSEEERIALAQTDLEKDFIKGSHILFGDGTKYDRDVAYKEYMATLAAKYPDNNEVSALYAISLLGAARNGRDETLFNQSARIAKGIIAENPNHPGALHYLIHSYDDPMHAHLAKAAADSYSKVAPDAAHALHMPSHIYVSLGRWDDVVTSNIASWNASIKRAERLKLNELGGSYHALNWLQYGFLQRGEVDAATMLLDRMIRYCDNDPTKQARVYLIAMKGAHMVETNTWSGEYADIVVEYEDLSIIDRSIMRFLEGMKSLKTGDTEALVATIETMKADREKASLTVGDKGFAMCNANGYANKLPSQIDIDMSYVLELELLAHHLSAQTNYSEAEEIWEQAVALDESLNYSFGPPSIVKPVHEAYAEWLLIQNEPQRAMEMYDKSLKRNPRRLLSLEGKKKAAVKVGESDIIAELQLEIDESLSQQERRMIL